VKHFEAPNNEEPTDKNGKILKIVCKVKHFEAPNSEEPTDKNAKKLKIVCR
jgi:hypothetical protein